MDPATDRNQQREKRARTTDPPKVSFEPKLPNGLRPIDAADRIATTVIKSLPLTIKPLAEYHFSVFLKHRMDLAQLYYTKMKLTNEDFTPRSARFKFILGTSDRVKEKAAEAFDSLVQKTNTALRDLTWDLKTHISATLDLDIKLLKEETRNEFCCAMMALAGSFAICKGLTKSQTQNLVFFTINLHHETLFKWTELTQETFLPTLKAAIRDITPDAQFGQLTEETAAEIREYEPRFSSILNNLFAKSWDAYLSTEAAMKLEAELKSFVETHMKEQKTSQTAMDLENDNLTQDAVKDLIADGVAKATRPMQRELESLKKLLNAERAQNSRSTPNEDKKTKPSPNATKTKGSTTPKNSRGAKNASAPSPKKKGPLKQSRPNAQKAGAQDNASNGGKNSNKNNRNNANKNNTSNSSRRGKKD
jgi:hypothetical protein